jgi:hypothetical protein
MVCRCGKKGPQCIIHNPPFVFLKTEHTCGIDSLTPPVEGIPGKYDAMGMHRWGANQTLDNANKTIHPIFKPTPPTESWEKEFDDMFVYKDGIMLLNTHDMPILKSFIKSERLKAYDEGVRVGMDMAQRAKSEEDYQLNK